MPEATLTVELKFFATATWAGGVHVCHCCWVSQVVSLPGQYSAGQFQVR